MRTFERTDRQVATRMPPATGRFTGWDWRTFYDAVLTALQRPGDLYYYTRGLQAVAGLPGMMTFTPATMIAAWARFTKLYPYRDNKAALRYMELFLKEAGKFQDVEDDDQWWLIEEEWQAAESQTVAFVPLEENRPFEGGAVGRAGLGAISAGTIRMLSSMPRAQQQQFLEYLRRGTLNVPKNRTVKPVDPAKRRPGGFVAPKPAAPKLVPPVTLDRPRITRPIAPPRPTTTKPAPPVTRSRPRITRPVAPSREELQAKPVTPQVERINRAGWLIDTMNAELTPRKYKPRRTPKWEISRAECEAVRKNVINAVNKLIVELPDGPDGQVSVKGKKKLLDQLSTTAFQKTLKRFNFVCRSEMPEATMGAATGKALRASGRGGNPRRTTALPASTFEELVLASVQRAKGLWSAIPAKFREREPSDSQWREMAHRTLEKRGYRLKEMEIALEAGQFQDMVIRALQAALVKYRIPREPGRISVSTWNAILRAARLSIYSSVREAGPGLVPGDIAPRATREMETDMKILRYHKGPPRQRTSFIPDYTEGAQLRPGETQAALVKTTRVKGKIVRTVIREAITAPGVFRKRKAQRPEPSAAKKAANARRRAQIAAARKQEPARRRAEAEKARTSLQAAMNKSRAEVMAQIAREVKLKSDWQARMAERQRLQRENPVYYHRGIPISRPS